MGLAGAAFTVVNEGINAMGTYGTYKDSKKAGHSTAYSIGKAGLDMAFYDFLGPWGIAFAAKDVFGAGLQISDQIGRQNLKIMSKQYGANFGGSFVDSSNAATMRQRGIQAIQQNGLNARSVLGNEARRYK